MDNFEHFPLVKCGRKSRCRLIVEHPSGASWHIHQYWAQPHAHLILSPGVLQDSGHYFAYFPPQIGSIGTLYIVC